MTIVILLLLAVLTAVAIGAMITAARWAGTDSRPRRAPLPRIEEDWSPDLPTHPYSR